MTRDECMNAINRVYGARAWAVVGYWNIQVETQPPRTIVLSQRFVATNIDGNGMSPEDLEAHFKAIPDSQWATESNGSLLLSLN